MYGLFGIYASSLNTASISLHVYRTVLTILELKCTQKSEWKVLFKHVLVNNETFDFQTTSGEECFRQCTVFCCQRMQYKMWVIVHGECDSSNWA
jgi:hypothetical protein